jgi:hypothetical protein
MKNTTVTIYGLVDPRTNDFFYIGSSVNPLARLRTHKSGGAAKVVAAITALAEDGLEPEVRDVETVPMEIRREREGYWINWFRSKGHRLVNSRAVWVENEIVSMGAMVYSWQIELIERRAQESGKPRAEVIRDMLTFALENMP